MMPLIILVVLAFIYYRVVYAAQKDASLRRKLSSAWIYNTIFQPSLVAFVFDICRLFIDLMYTACGRHFVESRVCWSRVEKCIATSLFLLVFMADNILLMTYLYSHLPDRYIISLWILPCESCRCHCRLKCKTEQCRHLFTQCFYFRMNYCWYNLLTWLRLDFDPRDHRSIICSNARCKSPLPSTVVDLRSFALIKTNIFQTICSIDGRLFHWIIQYLIYIMYVSRWLLLVYRACYVRLYRQFSVQRW